LIQFCQAVSRRALSIRKKLLGAEHPDTAQSMNNLAELLRAKGDYEAAEPLYRRALDIFTKVLGEQHPNTITVSGNLEYCREKMNGK